MKEDDRYYKSCIQLIVNSQLSARFVALPKDLWRKSCRGARRHCTA